MRNEKRTNAVVGIIANPLSARDIRRLVSQASGLQIADRANMIVRAIAGLSATGVAEIILMPDSSGLSAMIMNQLGDIERRKSRFDADIRLIDMQISGTVEDSRQAAISMVEKPVDAIIVLGGDGTSRAVAEIVKDIPMTCLSTGTNNAFPVNVESTIAGVATGMVATGQVGLENCCTRNKILHLYRNGEKTISALVDIVVTNSLWNGSLALWKPEMIDQVYVTYASPLAVGISSIAANVETVGRDDDFGLYVEIDNSDDPLYAIQAPIVPGLINRIGIKAHKRINYGTLYPVTKKSCALAVDGERCVEVDESERIEIMLDRNGPVTIDIHKTMQEAYVNGVLKTERKLH